MDYTATELACGIGSFFGAAFASYGAYQFTEWLIGHQFGVLVGGYMFPFVLTLMLRGVEDMRRPRLEQRREVMREYVRKLNSN